MILVLQVHVYNAGPPEDTILYFVIRTDGGDVCNCLSIILAVRANLDKLAVIKVPGKNAPLFLS